jgi:hypothetical protein
LRPAERLVDNDPEFVSQVTSLVKYVAACTQELAEATTKPEPTSYRWPSLELWGLDFQKSCVVDVELVLASLPAMHPLRAAGFGPKWMNLFLSLKWADACEPTADGLTFVELALAFVTQTRSWLPRRSGKSWACPEGDVVQTSLQALAAVTARCAGVLLHSDLLQPAPSVSPRASLKYLGYRGHSRPHLAGLLSRPSIPTYMRVAAIFKCCRRDDVANPIRRTCDHSLG